MALTITRIPGVEPDPQRVGQYLAAFRSVAFDNNYTTGGVALTPTLVGLSDIFEVHAHAAGGRVFEYDYVNQKLKAFQSAGSAAAFAEVPNATDLSAVTTRVVIYGR